MGAGGNKRHLRLSKDSKRPVSHRNYRHTHGGAYVIVSEGERDSSFLHNNGKNKWPVTKRSEEEIESALQKLQH